MAERIELKVPDLGDFSDVEIIEVLVSPGDEVAVEDGLVTLETDKASMDVPASHAGKIVSVDVAVGDTVSTGDLVATAEPVGKSQQAPGEEAQGADEDEDWSGRALLDTDPLRAFLHDQLDLQTAPGNQRLRIHQQPERAYRDALRCVDRACEPLPANRKFQICPEIVGCEVDRLVHAALNEGDVV